MKDFTFISKMPSFKFKSYGETAKTARKCGVFPIEEPSRKQIETVQGILDRCLPIEVVARWIEQSEKTARKVEGVYIFDSSTQTEESTLRDAYAVTNSAGTKDRAIIGLSVDLLDFVSNEFKDVVFLHELAHASLESMGHDESFVISWNLRLEQYFTFEEQIEVREDSRTHSRRRPQRRTY